MLIWLVNVLENLEFKSDCDYDDNYGNVNEMLADSEICDEFSDEDF